LNIGEVLRQTAGSIAAHKLRSFLTMFGIIWGITSKPDGGNGLRSVAINH